MKLNQLTKTLVVTFAFLGIVPVQAKSEIYVTEKNSAPIEGDKYEVVERVYAPRTKIYRNNKKQHHTTRYVVKESSPVTMASVGRVIAYTAGVGALAFVAFGIYCIAYSLRLAGGMG